MFRNLSIFKKLTLSYLLIGALTVSLASLFFYRAFKNALLERTFAQLSSINILKKNRIEELIRSENLHSDTPSKKVEETLEKILLERTGMGKSGESYMVNHYDQMITRSRFFPQEPTAITVHTQAVTSARKGSSEKGIIVDYRHIEVLSVYRRIQVNGLDWVIISEIDMDEAMKPVYVIRNYIIAVLIIVSVVTVLISLYFSTRISEPILSLEKHIHALSLGRIPVVEEDEEDFMEINRMIDSVKKLAENIAATAAFASEIGAGKYATQYSPLSEEDILGKALLKMRDSLKELKEKEISLVRQRSAALIEGEEKERERIARELHDSVGQMLTAVRFQFEALSIEEGKKIEVKKMIDESISEIRKISHNAMPSGLLDLGLEPALQSLCHKMSIPGKISIEMDYHLESKDTVLSFDIRVCLYRIAQECLNNILKHSSATRALVVVTKSSVSIEMDISDNGKGFNRNDSSQGNGLKNITERAEILGGRVKILSSESKGTKIKVLLPL
ncbi:MAG TPA: sensor histidine kinase [Cytophagaceae bacterium]|nr:sensor histidine kinase [Cytophagaceae bacterium]